MTPDQLRFALVELGITQVHLARLIEITPRAITLWLGSERGIPGSVEAYLRLLLSLPQSERQLEFARLNKGIETMKDGIYKIDYLGTAGTGYAMLVFEGGHIYGSDVARGEYDGHYVPNQQTGMVEISCKVKMPANTASVIGMTQPFEWTLDVEASMNPRRDVDQLSIRNNLGQPLNARYEFMRGLPV